MMICWNSSKVDEAMPVSLKVYTCELFKYREYIKQERRIAMPDFGSPFSGLASERKLTDEELIRAIKFLIAAEYEANQLYAQLAESTDNKLAIAVLKVHRQ